MNAVREPAHRTHSQILRQDDGMGFSSINLPNVETSFIGEGEIAAIPRDSSRADAIVGGIGSQLRRADWSRSVLLRQEQAELYSEQNEDNGARAGKNPPDVKARSRVWIGRDSGRLS